MSSVYDDMAEPEIRVAEFLRDIDLWWVYEFPVFVYDKKGRPRVWTPDFYIPRLGMYIEVCGKKREDYSFREEIFKENGYYVIFIHYYKQPKKWKNYLVGRIREIEELRHAKVMEMIASLDSRH